MHGFRAVHRQSTPLHSGLTCSVLFQPPSRQVPLSDGSQAHPLALCIPRTVTPARGSSLDPPTCLFLSFETPFSSMPQQWFKKSEFCCRRSQTHSLPQLSPLLPSPALVLLASILNSRL